MSNVFRIDGGTDQGIIETKRDTLLDAEAEGLWKANRYDRQGIGKFFDWRRNDRQDPHQEIG